MSCTTNLCGNSIIIDDHPVMQEGLASLLERNGYPVSARVSSVAELERLLSGCQLFTEQTVAFIDKNLKDGENGFDALSLIRGTHPEIKCILYTAYDTASFAVQAFERGAAGYVTKDADVSELLDALREVSAGRTYIQKSIQGRMFNASRLLSLLTKKERGVVSLAIEGLDDAGIAQRLGVSLRTVENHLSAVYDRLGVKNKPELLEKLNSPETPGGVQVFDNFSGGGRR